jgi:hypothetical protein
MVQNFQDCPCSSIPSAGNKKLQRSMNLEHSQLGWWVAIAICIVQSFRQSSWPWIVQYVLHSWVGDSAQHRPGLGNAKWVPCLADLLLIIGPYAGHWGWHGTDAGHSLIQCPNQVWVTLKQTAYHEIYFYLNDSRSTLAKLITPTVSKPSQ